MQTNETDTSGSTNSTSGESENLNQTSNAPDTSGSESPKGNLVSRESYDKVLREVNNWRSKAKEEEEKRLTEQGNFKELADARLVQIQELEGKVGNYETKNRESKIDLMLKKHLSVLGLRPEAESKVLSLYRAEKNQYGKVFLDEETDTVIGAEEAAKAFYEDNKTFGFFGKGGVGVDFKAPSDHKSQTQLVLEAANTPGATKQQELDNKMAALKATY